MKRSQTSRRTVGILTALTAFVIACSAIEVMAAHDSGQLVIKRAANIGNLVFINVAIDGKAVASIGYGRDFKTAISPGRHLLSIKATPRRTYFKDTWEMTLDVSPGQTYELTATKQGDLVVLRPSR